MLNSLFMLAVKKASSLYITCPLRFESIVDQRIPLTKGQYCGVITISWRHDDDYLPGSRHSRMYTSIVSMQWLSALLCRKHSRIMSRSSKWCCKTLRETKYYYKWNTMAQHRLFSIYLTWWRHQMETFSALLAICAGNSPVTGEFPSQKASDAELWYFLWSAPEWTVE